MAQHSDQSISADMVRRHDRDRWLTAALAPRESRHGLLSLFALNLEIARIKELVGEPMAGLIRLQWWRESLAEAADGRVRDHPVLRAAAPLLGAGKVSVADLKECLDARETDFESAGPKDMAAFAAYCQSTGGVLCRMAVKILGVERPETKAAAETIGTAHAMVGQLRNTAWSAGRGRVLLPRDLLVRHGVSVDGLLAGTPGSGLAHAAGDIAAEAARELAEARLRWHDVPKAALPALLIARIADAQLRSLQRGGFDLFSGRCEPLPMASFLAVLRGAVSGRY